MSHRNKIYPINKHEVAGPKVQKKQKPPYHEIVLGILPIFAGGLALWAMINLHLEIDAAVLFKAFMIGIVAGLVSYCINRFAIDWGAELTASGMPAAGIFSVFSILAVGFFLWFFSFGGITLPDVRILRMEDHGQNIARYAELQNNGAAQAMRIVPAINSIASDLSYHRKCEIENGCLSGRGGGAGTLSNIVGERAVRADNIAAQLSQGTELQSSTLEAINELLGRYQSTLNDGSKSLFKRRQALVKIDAEFGQAIARLNEAVPVTLIAAYAEELKTPVTILGRPEAARAVNTLLGKHGRALSLVISTIENNAVERPIFPAKAGLSDTFDYIGNFAALAGIIWVAEGIFPLALFLYTLWFLIRRRELDNKPTTPNTPASDAIRFVPVNSAHWDAEVAKYVSKKMNGGGHV